MEKQKLGVEAPSSMLQKLETENPGKRLEHAAVMALVDPEQIKQFIKEYVELLRNEGENNPEEVVDRNISWALRDFQDKDKTKLWKKILDLKDQK